MVYPRLDSPKLIRNFKTNYNGATDNLTYHLDGSQRRELRL